MPPKVSAICIFFNAHAFFREAIESVLTQDFQDFELLLVDDGSSDSSSEIAREFAARFPRRIRLLEHEGHANLGMSASRNLGLAHAAGEYAAFVDADDRWRSVKLAEQVAILDDHPEVGMVCGRVNYWKKWAGGLDRLVPTGHIVDGTSAPPKTIFALYPLGAADAPCPSDVMIRMSVLNEIGGFEAEFRGPLQMYEDQAFFAKLYLHAPVYFSSRVWMDYRIHNESCVSTVTRDGLYAVVRSYFLDWLESYVAGHDVADVQSVQRAVDHARWELRHRGMARLLRRGRRARALLLRLTGLSRDRAQERERLAET